MISLISDHEAQQQLSQYLRECRLEQGLTQQGLATRSGISVATLRKFERTGQVSLRSFLRLALVLGVLTAFMSALEPPQSYESIEQILKSQPPQRQRGWRN